MAKKDTIKTSVHRKLEQLGTNLINQANNNKALKKIGKTKDVESLRDALNNIFEEVGPSEYNKQRLKDIIQKCKQLQTLIKKK